MSSIDTAMVFAAGLGTRLRPLTNDRPKALVEIAGKSLLEWNLRKLESAGFQRVVVNIHHFADRMRAFFGEHSFNMEILISDETGKLLETGGGLLKAVPLLESADNFLVCNVDILYDLNLEKFASSHLNSQALATLAVRQRTTSRYLLMDETMRLRGWENAKTGELRLAEPDHGFSRWGFSGIQILSSEFLSLIPQQGKFSIIESYLSLASNHLIRGYDHTEGFWLDVGKPESLEPAKKWVSGS